MLEVNGVQKHIERHNSASTYCCTRNALLIYANLLQIELCVDIQHVFNQACRLFNADIQLYTS